MRMTKERAIEILTIDAERASFFEVAEAVDLAVEALKEQKWIPCSERLPEEHHIYLTTIKKANGITLTTHSYFFTKEVGWSDACVIAWMPLPEPYKRGEAK